MGLRIFLRSAAFLAEMLQVLRSHVRAQVLLICASEYEPIKLYSGANGLRCQKAP